ncbi:Monooxygenase, FAD-binding protein [Corchorus olitorius]|uniref:Monooxygenase, FAD-binding protein n=1 Tax=Corchorus olitorius TaxID=93759 RepID=A0A1R3HUX9_9ROSI|nr:Monooxygenase, FAD-binding protein [Corchorus olitorius]
MEEIVEQVVIIGAGIAGLATSLGLHRYGITSLVLESSDKLRVTGFALGIWENAWKALDALGIGHLRQQHTDIQRLVVTSTSSKQQTAEVSFKGHELRCVQRKLLLEALAAELPNGTIRYSSKVVSIEDSGHFKRVHLADGTTIKTKVLIGCDGVNSLVAKWLGFEKPTFTGRSTLRGFADLKNGHGFKQEFKQFVGKGVRSGFIPCNDRIVYWFLTWNPASLEEAMENNPVKLRQFVLNKLEDTPDEIKEVIENTPPEGFAASSPLRYRRPWEIVWGNISNGNVCVAGDALHPMTPDIGQGGCAALEDAVVLSRCLAQVLSKSGKLENTDEDYKRIELALKKYAKERRWRSFDLISTAYIVGFIQQNNWKIISFFRDKVLSPFLSRLLLSKSGFDCGKLNIV